MEMYLSGCENNTGRKGAWNSFSGELKGKLFWRERTQKIYLQLHPPPPALPALDTGIFEEYHFIAA